MPKEKAEGAGAGAVPACGCVAEEPPKRPPDAPKVVEGAAAGAAAGAPKAKGAGAGAEGVLVLPNKPTPPVPAPKALAPPGLAGVDGFPNENDVVAPPVVAPPAAGCAGCPKAVAPAPKGLGAAPPVALADPKPKPDAMSAAHLHRSHAERRAMLRGYLRQH